MSDDTTNNDTPATPEPTAATVGATTAPGTVGTSGEAMSTETAGSGGGNEQPSAPPVSPKREPAREIRAEVAERLKNAAPAIQSAVADSLYQKEEKRRIDAVMKVVDEIDALEKEVKNLSNGDIKTFDAEGKQLPAVFSQERTKARKEAEEKLGKARGKLNKALLEGDWSKLLGG